MKFVVMVNQKYLVTVEANTAGGAEHKILDNIYYGIETAQAFKAEEMRTEFFMSCFEKCETISYSELMDKAAEYKKATEEKDAQLNKIVECLNKINALENEIKKAKNDLSIYETNVKTLEHDIATIF